MPGAGIPSENNIGMRDKIKHDLISHYSIHINDSFIISPSIACSSFMLKSF